MSQLEWELENAQVGSAGVGVLESELEAELEGEWETEGEWELDGVAQREMELVTTGAEYNVYGRDDRILVQNTRIAPFRYIAKLEMVFVDPRTRAPRHFLGTGAIVAPGKVLTAAHCVFDRQHGYGYAQQIRVIPGKNGPGRSRGEEPFGFAMSRRLDVPTNWRTAPRTTQGGQSALPHDFAVITLDRPIGRRVGGWWKRMAHKTDTFLSQHRVNTSGYPGDKGGNRQYRVYNRIVRVHPQRLEFIHDVMGGQSGSPIWVRWQNYRIIVGIVTTHDDPFTAVHANTGVRITPAVLTDVNRWLRT
jgi:V8-like Glu-specific endopeptidase